MVKVLLKHGLDTALIHKNIVIKMDIINPFHPPQTSPISLISFISLISPSSFIVAAGVSFIVIPIECVLFTLPLFTNQ